MSFERPGLRGRAERSKRPGTPGRKVSNVSSDVARLRKYGVGSSPAPTPSQEGWILPGLLGAACRAAELSRKLSLGRPDGQPGAARSL